MYNLVIIGDCLQNGSFSANSLLNKELSICPLFKNVYFYASYSNNNEDMAI